MAKLSLTKSGLQKERTQLSLYRRVLPSLDLKRQQLTIELGKARKQLEESQSAFKRLTARVGEELPMLASEDIDVSGLVQMESVQRGQENVVGVKLPTVSKVQCTVRDYSMLAKPPWVDMLVERLKAVAELYARTRISEERVKLLERAVRRITQRVNLFDKVLIPTARKNIQRIQIFLGDAERTSVVRSKIAKAKHAAS